MRRLHILLVDSDPNACDRLQRALESASEFFLQSIASLTEARQCLTESIPDVLICEVVLGQENGLELCRYIRNSPSLRHMPIMLLTTLTTLQDKVAGFAAGADDYVVKPCDTRHLVARIRLLLRIKRLQQQPND